MLSRWLYVSSVASRMSEDQVIADIVLVSRMRNAQLDVTGALAFARGRFVQFIEGPDDSVMALEQSIIKDRRHYAIKTLMRERIAVRRFDGWSLAYSGNSAFIEQFITRTSSPNLTTDDQDIMALIALLVEFSTG